MIGLYRCLTILLSFTLVASLPTITPSEVVSSPPHLSLEIYRGANTNTPCTGINGTLNWPVENTASNSTESCFSTGAHYITCIRRQFQQFDDPKVDVTPRLCSIEGYRQEDCGGLAVPASYTGAAEWTWNGVDMGVVVQSSRMDCAVYSTPQ